MGANTDLNKLRELLIGKSITDLVPNTKDEGIFIISALDGVNNVSIELFANDLGWWIKCKESQIGLSDILRYKTLEEMLKESWDHRCPDGLYDPVNTRLISHRDLGNRLVGYQCLTCQELFLTSITSVRESTHPYKEAISSEVLAQGLADYYLKPTFETESPEWESFVLLHPDLPTFP